MSRIEMLRARSRACMPGLWLCTTIALAAMFMSEHYNAPVMLFALLLGMAFNFIDPDGKFAEGVRLSSKVLLRFGIVLLGVRITLSDMYALGLQPVVIAVAGLATTIALGTAISRALGRRPIFGVLTGGAVGICGASAALALSAVLPQGKSGIEERDTVFTVVAVTALSSIAMIAYPLVCTALGLDDRAAGVFIGATVHDVAQVVGAGYTVSEPAGDTATVVKLFRVAMLVPVLLVAAVAFRSSAGNAGAIRIPGFLLGFVALVCLNSAFSLPVQVTGFLADASRFLLVVSIAGIGIKTNLRDLSQVGARAIVVIVGETVWLALFALAVLVAF
ncbi:MAG: putative sulfate exporter family transporter [Brucellaceae bacterium]|nr:putative sulfate exporter family transporter [Brucellaceae bacterium]